MEKIPHLEINGRGAPRLPNTPETSPATALLAKIFLRN